MHTNIVRIRSRQSLQFLNSVPSKQEKAAISKAEAEILIHKISSSSHSVFKNVVLLVKTKGYLALGYHKVQDCLRKKVPELSNSYICRLLKAAETYLNLDSSMKYIDRVAEATFRPLQNVSDANQQVVWKIVVEGSKRITSRDIKRVMEQQNISASIEIKSNFKPDNALHKTLCFQAKRFATIIGATAKSKDEWQQLCKVFYKELLDTCPYNQIAA